MLGLFHCHHPVTLLIPAQPARAPPALPSPTGSTCSDAPDPTCAVGNCPQQIPHPRSDPIQHLWGCWIGSGAAGTGREGGLVPGGLEMLCWEKWEPKR